MPTRVYECDKSEAQTLKKALEYDPYTDTSVIPSAPGCADKPLDKLSDAERIELDEYEKKVKKALDNLDKDPRAQAIFIRQTCSLRDGAMLGLSSDKMYLYIEATDEFFAKAEQRFKSEFKSIKRAQKKDEESVITTIKNEEEKAGTGFGSIFGG
jgi:hypothetical protein